MLRNPLFLLVGGMRFERTTPGFGGRYLAVNRIIIVHTIIHSILCYT